TERPDARELGSLSVAGTVEFDRGWFAYPPPRELSGDIAVASDHETDADGWTLRDISVRVEAGQFAAIVGPSGAGKRSAGCLVPRFDDVSRGAARIAGQDVRDLTRP